MAYPVNKRYCNAFGHISLKCENIYINEYNTPRELRHGIRDFIKLYNTERPHTTHGGDYPYEAYMQHFAA